MSVGLSLIIPVVILSVFSSLTQAVGAADKVFELMHRKPRYKAPSAGYDAEESHAGILGISATKTSTFRKRGLSPDTCRGEVKLENVALNYPARPQRRVLNGLTLDVPPGSVVALVGSSGGGKSSVMSLIQHLYEPSEGRVLLDGNEVRSTACSRAKAFLYIRLSITREIRFPN